MQLAPGAIYGNSTEMREAIRLNLSKALANFLFDDYKMLGNDLLDKGANAVHLFNLNGIRVPLSYFLAQAAEALAETAKATNGIFNISIHVPEILYGGSEYYYDDYTPDMWAAQQAHTLYNSTITVTFLKKFNESMLKFFGNLV